MHLIQILAQLIIIVLLFLTLVGAALDDKFWEGLAFTIGFSILLYLAGAFSCIHII